jgi:autoinducer 2-degrading protein
VLVTCVHIWVKKEHIQDFIAATTANHQGATKEPGNLRFDLLQHQTDPCRFMLYEAYFSAEAAAAHKLTSHYQKWKESVGPWMAKAREGVPYNVVCPAERSEW